MQYKRRIERALRAECFLGKVLVLVGPRQVGKTTLSEEVVGSFAREGRVVKRINCDNPTDREALTNRDLSYLKNVVGEADIVFIDEGQKVVTIGQTLKLLVDYYKAEKQIIVTGSSSFNLLDKTQEALTGRKRVYHLYPISAGELYTHNDMLALTKDRETHLVYGMYPEVLNTQSFEGKRSALAELASSQLYKDVLEFQEVKDSTTIHNLLKALALQVGSEVSYTELASLVGVDKNTVERYVDLLEKNFIVFRLAPYFSNKRNEIKKQKKIYFLDVGIRNALIQNFNTLDTRNDVGALWENYLMVERLKKRSYENIYANQYFWRTYDQKEVDLVEEREGKLFGYEFKWSVRKLPRPPRAWVDEYAEASYEVITPENYGTFVL